MSVSTLIITHANIGHELLNTAETMFNELPMDCRALSVSPTCDPDKVLTKAESLIQKLDNGKGVLILTDIFGSTPSNICNKLNDMDNVHVIAGVNLPMLVRIFNYADSDLNELVEKALSGGHDGIIYCDQK